MCGPVQNLPPRADNLAYEEEPEDDQCEKASESEADPGWGKGLGSSKFRIASAPVSRWAIASRAWPLAPPHHSSRSPRLGLLPAPAWPQPRASRIADVLAHKEQADDGARRVPSPSSCELSCYVLLGRGNDFSAEPAGECERISGVACDVHDLNVIQALFH